MDRGAWWATVHGVVRVRHNLVTKTTTKINKNHNEKELSGWNYHGYFVNYSHVLNTTFSIF